MKCAVIYRSRKGKTRKLAEAIAEVCNVTAIDITEPHVLGEVQLLFVGTGIYHDRPDDLMLDYIDRLPAKKIRAAVIFSSSSTGKDHTELAVNMLKHKGIAMCREHFVIKIPRFFAKNCPSEADLARIREFTERVLAAFKTEKA